MQNRCRNSRRDCAYEGGGRDRRSLVTLTCRYAIRKSIRSSRASTLPDPSGLEIDALEPRFDVGPLVSRKDLVELVLGSGAHRRQDVSLPWLARRHQPACRLGASIDHVAREAQPHKAARLLQDRFRVGA